MLVVLRDGLVVRGDLDHPADSETRALVREAVTRVLA
jgi:hypothetical protein